MSPSFRCRNINNNDSTPPFSSSSSSSVLSFSPAKTMEEVWQDITLASLDDNCTSNKRSTTPRPPFPSMILKDFLASPARRDQSPAQADDPVMGSSRPPTLLSLNSASSHDFLCFPNHIQMQNPQFNGHTATFPSSGSGSSGLFSPFEVVLGSSPAIFKKRPQQDNQDSDSGGDRRQKRMIKNRESAARSRARKQAYAQELEMELAQLRKENNELRKEQEKLLTERAKFTKRKKLYRSSTAPF